MSISEVRKDFWDFSLLNEDHEQSVKENRMYLQVIIECLMYTAQQNIPQRGHKEV